MRNIHISPSIATKDSPHINKITYIRTLYILKRQNLKPQWIEADCSANLEVPPIH